MRFRFADDLPQLGPFGPTLPYCWASVSASLASRDIGICSATRGGLLFSIRPKYHDSRGTKDHIGSRQEKKDAPIEARRHAFTIHRILECRNAHRTLRLHGHIKDTANHQS